MTKESENFQRRLKAATCLEDLIVRKAPHNFPTHSLSPQQEAAKVNKHRILDFMREAEKEVSISDGMQATALSYPYVHKLMSELVACGMATKRAVGAKKFYKLT